MDNFNLRAFLAKNPLNEAMSPQDVVDIADTVAEEFTIESAEEGDFLVYSVGKMNADNMSFELDTDLTSQSPKDIDMRGVGEGWGGIFRIKPTADGYEVRNAEKGGLVAIIDNMGNFKMLSADESRAEMGLEENKEETKSNKMKKSELKEMIKAAFLNETELEEDQIDAAAVQSDENEAMDQVDEASKESFDDAFDRIDKEKEVYQGSDKDEVKEAEEDEVADEVEVDAEETEDVETADAEVEDTETVDVEATAEISPEVKATQDALTAAIEAAKALGDQKLADQIGNSITFFTRTHVVGQDKVAEGVEMPANVVNKANIAVKDAATMAATMLDLYKQIQDKEQVDMSKNQTFKMVLNYLEKLASQAKAGGAEEKEEVAEDLSMTRMLKNAGIKK